jgi:hypothetical protein
VTPVLLLPAMMLRSPASGTADANIRHVDAYAAAGVGDRD